MPLDPRLQPVVDAANSATPLPDTATVAERRDAAHAGMELGFLAFGDPGPEPATTVDHRVAVDGGEIMVRVYTPAGDGPFPAHLYIHGGGWWIGTIDHFDGGCRATSAGAHCVVASVDYRLAPEHKYPTAPEDCYTALLWLVAHADELGVDPTRISVGGASAGGNLAAVLALMARDRGGPPLVFQVLEIPATDLTLASPSIEENAHGYFLTKAAMEQCVDYYLATPDTAKEPYASPLYADDLSDLPPALVMTAELDPLRDEGEAYGRRLQGAGIPTTIRRWDGHIHGSQTFAKLLPEDAAEYQAMVTEALLAAYEN